MVCLFHGDYGPANPAFNLGSGSTWVVDANSLKDARNLEEAQGDQGYAWVDQNAVVWFYFAAFLFVILPYLIIRAMVWAKRAPRPGATARRLGGRLRLPR
jgi:hypothetical protein